MPSKKDWLQKHFIGPVMEEKPDALTELEHAEQVLNLPYRSMASYRVKSGCKLTCSQIEAGVHPTSGVTVRFQKDWTLLVRKDVREVFYTVETLEQVYRLSSSQWKTLRKHIGLKKGFYDVDGSAPNSSGS